MDVCLFIDQKPANGVITAPWGSRIVGKVTNTLLRSDTRRTTRVMSGKMLGYTVTVLLLLLRVAASSSAGPEIDCTRECNVAVGSSAKGILRSEYTLKALLDG